MLDRNAFEANRLLLEELNETTGTRLHKDLNLLPIPIVENSCR